MISLKLIYNDGEKESLVFNQPTITIGRSSDNDVSLITANGVSRHHAKFYLEEDQLIIEDLNSTNGTFLNSQKITKSAVVPKDVVEIGSVCIKAIFSNLAESSASNKSLEITTATQDPLELLKSCVPEAFEKIQERGIDKVLIRPNSRVKFFEHGREVELGLSYPNNVLMRIADSFRVTALRHLKITRNIICSIAAPPLVNEGVCLCFEKIDDEILSLDDYVTQGVCCRDAERILVEAYARGKNVIFGGADRKIIQGLMLALIEEKDSQVCFLDRVAKLVTPKESISFSARSEADLLDSAQYSVNYGLHKFFIDDISFYDKGALSNFVNLFNKGGIAFIEAQTSNKAQSKIAEICGVDADFWCHVLVWFDKSGTTLSIKNIFKVASSDLGVEFVEIFNI